eukprot:403364661
MQEQFQEQSLIIGGVSSLNNSLDLLQQSSSSPQMKSDFKKNSSNLTNSTQKVKRIEDVMININFNSNNNTQNHIQPINQTQQKQVLRLGQSDKKPNINNNRVKSTTKSQNIKQTSNLNPVSQNQIILGLNDSQQNYQQNHSQYYSPDLKQKYDNTEEINYIQQHQLDLAQMIQYQNQNQGNALNNNVQLQIMGLNTQGYQALTDSSQQFNTQEFQRILANHQNYHQMNPTNEDINKSMVDVNGHEFEGVEYFNSSQYRPLQNDMMQDDNFNNIETESKIKKRPITAGIVGGTGSKRNRMIRSRQQLQRNNNTTNKKSMKEESFLIGSNKQLPQSTKNTNQKNLQKFSSIDACFPTNLNRVAFGTVSKAFVKPLSFKFGATFKNKSEESRYYKIQYSILKLRHLLVNDPPSSHEYIFKFLKQFFSLEEISKFSDDGLKNFIQAIIEVRILNPNVRVEDFIKQSMKPQRNLEQYYQSTATDEGIDSHKLLIQDQLYNSTGKIDLLNSTQRNRLTQSSQGIINSSEYLQIHASTPGDNRDLQEINANAQSRSLLNFIKKRDSLSPTSNMKNAQIEVPKMRSRQVQSANRTTSSAVGMAQSKAQFQKLGFSRNQIEQQLNTAVSPVKYIMYSPISGKPEPFVQNTNIPKLAPMDKIIRKTKPYESQNSSQINQQLNEQIQINPKRLIHNYINQQDIRIAYEIQPPSCKEPNKECQLSLLSEIEGYNPTMKELKSKYTKDGIMRRNKLLLEHIMHERLERSISTINYYQGFAYQKQEALDKILNNNSSQVDEYQQYMEGLVSNEWSNLIAQPNNNQ